MKFKFSAKIYKVGINPCVRVPFKITDKMTPSKGYIPVKGTIKGHPFEQTLCAVKDEEFRLYVNGPMLKGSGLKVGNKATFEIEQNLEPEKRKDILMPKTFKKKLEENGLMDNFNALTPYRRKEIVKYLNFLKSEEALERNTKKVLDQLRKGSATARIP
jgi:hypothetical protein